MITNLSLCLIKARFQYYNDLFDRVCEYKYSVRRNAEPFIFGRINPNLLKQHIPVVTTFPVAQTNRIKLNY